MILEHIGEFTDMKNKLLNQDQQEVNTIGHGINLWELLILHQSEEDFKFSQDHVQIVTVWNITDTIFY